MGGNVAVGPFVADLIANLSDALGANLWDLIEGIDYRPPNQADLALHLTSPVPRLEFRSDFLRQYGQTGVFLNLHLDPTVLALRRESVDRGASRRVAIEHTSLVPAYPINVATFRSSVIGEWIRRSLDFLGHEAHCHCWIETQARQLVLLSHEWSGRRSAGKQDHAAGLLFMCGVHGANPHASEVASRARELFPLHGPLEDLPPDSGAALVGNLALAQRVAGGWSSTFAEWGFAIPEYDFDSEIRDAAQGLALLETDRGSTQLIEGSASLNYLDRNVRYYTYLLLGHESVYSIVPERQAKVCERASVIATSRLQRDPSDLKVHAYGDVHIDGSLDSTRELRYHPIDSYVEAGRRVAPSDEAIHRALTGRFLSARARTTLHLQTSSWFQNRRPHSRPMSSHPVVRALLLEDELPGLLMGAVDGANFALVMRWCAEAVTLLERKPTGLPAQLSSSLEKAVRTFSVW